MIIEVNKRHMREALRKLSFFFTNSSAEWANAISLIVRSKNGISALDLFIQTPTESFQTLVSATSVEDFTDDEVVIDGSLLTDIVTKSSGPTLLLDINMEEGALKVSAGDTEWIMPFLIKTLPRVKCVSTPKMWSSEELSGALGRIKSSIGLDIGRPYLMIANILDGRLQACDGFKLQETRISNKELEMAIPSNVVQPLLRLLETDGWVGAEFAIYDEGRIVCLWSNFDKFAFFKPKAEFPDLTSMVVNPLKSKIPSVLTVNRKSLIAKIEQVQILANKKSPQVVFELAEGALTLSCGEKDNLKSQSKMDTNWAGARKILRFDVKSLLEVLRSVKEEDIEIRISKDKKDENGPIAVESENLWSMINQVRAT